MTAQFRSKLDPPAGWIDVAAAAVALVALVAWAIVEWAAA